MSSQPGAESSDARPSSIPKQPPRRRARRACIACHERKVRCDVLQRQPCTNCVEDRCRCVVRNHANRRASVAALELPPSPAGSTPEIEMDSAIPFNRQSHYMEPRPQDGFLPRQSLQMSNDQQMFDTSALVGRDWPGKGAATIMPDTDNYDGFGQPLYYDFDALSDANALLGLERVFHPVPGYSNALMPHPMTRQSPTVSMMAAESVHSPAPDAIDFSGSFIGHQAPADLGQRAQEMEFLRSQGCFLFPSARLFLQVMTAYFTHVHPNLPIINEADFWGLWRNGTFRLGSFSALVLQSMAFAATSFTPTAILQEYGFNTPRKALMTFYRRAKLLSDMDIESDHVSIAQSALLLTYFSSSESRFLLNSQWLSRAIRFAKVARADRFDELDPEEQHKKSTLKRLWWGCVMRDRVMALGLRRPLQIKGLASGLHESSFLEESDFADELRFSRVHDENTQRLIFRIINLTSKLVDALTSPLNILYTAERPCNRTLCSPEELPRALCEVKRQFDLLRQWQELALQHFPSPIGLDEEHPTISVFANLMFIYYNAAILALSHHAMLLWETRSPALENRPHFEPPTLEIKTAIDDTTDRVRELVQLKCAQYLPISVSAYLTLPLLLHALSVKATASETDAALARRQLAIYARCMKFQQNLYDGTDLVFELIDNVQKYSDEQNTGTLVEKSRAPGSGHASGSATPIPIGKTTRPPPAWEELLVRRPKLYLRLVLHIDVAFCEGSPPTESDFPEPLRRTSR